MLRDPDSYHWRSKGHHPEEFVVGCIIRNQDIRRRTVRLIEITTGEGPTFYSRTQRVDRKKFLCGRNLFNEQRHTNGREGSLESCILRDMAPRILEVFHRGVLTHRTRRFYDSCQTSMPVPVSSITSVGLPFSPPDSSLSPIKHSVLRSGARIST